MSADEVIAVIIGICGYPITVGRVVELELYLGNLICELRHRYYLAILSIMQEQ